MTKTICFDCPHCGKPVQATDKYCSACAKPLSGFLANPVLYRPGHTAQEEALRCRAWRDVLRSKQAQYDLRDLACLHVHELQRYGLLPLQVLLFLLSLLLGNALTQDSASRILCDLVYYGTVVLIGFLLPWGLSLRRNRRVRACLRLAMMTNRQLQRYYGSLPEPPIPFELSNPRLVERLCRLLETGEAQTLPQAVSALKAQRRSREKGQECISSDTDAERAALHAMGRFWPAPDPLSPVGEGSRTTGRPLSEDARSDRL